MQSESSERGPKPMSNAERVIVVCPTCSSETPMADLRDGDVCPECRQEIPDDAGAKVPTDMVDGNWDMALPDEPMGGYHFEADEVTEPERDVAAITEVLSTVEQGDVVEVTIGAVEFEVTANLYVVTHERDAVGFDHRISMCPAPREDGWTRLYTTGTGASDLDAWEVVSSPYDLDGDGTLDVRDFAAHGWLLNAEVTDDSPDCIDAEVDHD